MLALKINNEYKFLNFDKSDKPEIFWKLPANIEEGDEELKSKHIRSIYYTETTNKSDKEKLYVYVDASNNNR